MATSFIGKLLVDSTHLPLEAATTILTMTSFFNWPPQATVLDGDSFDFIIIGSGAGAVVSNRLTENEIIRVLLVEAGMNPSVESMLPGLFIALQNSYQDWNYKAEAEEASKYQQNGTYTMSSGKCLGGSAGINHFVHVRGDKYDFDSWAEYLQDKSWSNDNVLPYFIKSETMDDADVMKYYSKYHGSNGPIIITKEPDDSTHKTLEAFEEIGVPWVLDLNANDSTGIAEASFIIGDGVRQTPAQGYLNNLDRANLYVLTETVAETIIFENKTATGVVLKRADGEKIKVYASKEVILSAGVYNSPKMLMLSGVGPAEDLEELGIEVIQDLPVGKEMQDHFGVFLVNKMDYSLEISQLPQITKLAFQVMLGGINLDESKSYPDYQAIVLKLTHDTPYMLLACSVLFGIEHEICTNLQLDTIGRNHLLSIIAALHPESRGYVKLKSANPDDDVIISELFYSNEQDFANMKKYVTHFLKLYNTTYFQDTGAEVADPGLEECGEMDLDNEDYLDCYIKSLTVVLFHATSTCAMGRVTDSNMMVLGVNNLRVVDASVMPNITRANPLAATIMMAEKISDVIKEKYDLFDTNEAETTTEATEASDEESDSIIDKIVDLFTG